MAVEEHVVGEDDPLAVDDVMETAAEGLVDPVAVAAGVHLAAFDAEVERPLALRPASGTANQRAEASRCSLSQPSIVCMGSG